MTDAPHLLARAFGPTVIVGTIQTICELLPIAVVVATRRPLRDRATHVALIWLVFFLVDLVGLGRALRVLPRWVPYTLLAVLTSTAVGPHVPRVE